MKIIMAAINIAMIVRSGPHDDVHLKKPAMSKKKVAMLSSPPEIETRAVMIIAVMNFNIPSPKNGISPAMLNMKIKKPIHRLRTIIRCWIEIPSSIPNIIFAGISISDGMSNCFSNMLFAWAFVWLPMSPSFVLDTLSFRSEVLSVGVSLSADRAKEVRSRRVRSITNSFFMCYIVGGCLNSFLCY